MMYHIPLFLLLITLSLPSCQFSKSNLAQKSVSKVGVGEQNRAVQPAQKSSTLRLRISEEPQHLDWNQGEVPSEIVLSLMRGLFRQDAQGLAVPDLATQVVKHSALEVTIKLLPAVIWSNGSHLSAQNFVDSWKRIQNPQFASPYRSSLAFLKSYQALDEHTLKLHFNYPEPAFEQIFSYWFTFPIPFGPGREKLILPAELISGAVPTLGPYSLKEISNQQKWSFIRNQAFVPNPASHEGLFFEQLIFRVIAEDLTAYNLYLNQQIDFLKSVPTFVKKQVPKPRDLKNFPAWIAYYLGFNHQKSPTKNIRIRQLLGGALNKQEIPLVLGGGEEPAREWVPFDLLDLGFEHYRDKAAAPPTVFALSSDELALLQNLVFHYYEKGTHRQLAEWLQQQWKKNLGISVSLQGHENQAYWDFLTQEQPELFLSGFTAVTPNPAPFFYEFESHNPANWNFFKNGEYDLLLNKLRVEKNQTQRLQLTKKLNDLLIKHKIIEPLYFRGNVVLIKPKLKNCWLNPFNFYYPAYFKE